MSEAGGNLLGQILRFGRLLRLMGVSASLRQMLDLVDATKYVPISEELNFYCAARVMLVHRREDLPVFDQAFAMFWRSQPQAAAKQKAGAEAKRARLPRQGGSRPSGEREDGDLRMEPTPGGGEDEGQKARDVRLARYSPTEMLRHKDFGEMTWEEIQAAKRAMNKLEWKLGDRRTRRQALGRRGRLDLRRIIRDNLSKGGELLELAYRTRVYQPRPLVVLCDVSGSMERYSRMLLHFTHALTHRLNGVAVEAFVFGTRLTRITHHLRHKDVDESLDEVGKAVPDWSGGTRIGEAIKNFNFHWARRVLGRGAVVLIISDGWDRGDVGLLEREMARLQLSAYRLMWLNPLMGANDYEPSQQGMAAALAHVDDLLPGYSLASLEQVAAVLSTVHLVRPGRKQQPRRSPVEAEADSLEIVRMEQRSLRKRAALFHRFSTLEDLGKLNDLSERSR